MLKRARFKNHGHSTQIKWISTPGAWRKTKATQFGWAGFSAAVFRAMDCGCNRISLSLKSVGRFDVFVACEVWQWERRPFLPLSLFLLVFIKLRQSLKIRQNFIIQFEVNFFTTYGLFPRLLASKKRKRDKTRVESPNCRQRHQHQQTTTISIRENYVVAS